MADFDMFEFMSFFVPEEASDYFNTLILFDDFASDAEVVADPPAAEAVPESSEMPVADGEPAPMIGDLLVEGGAAVGEPEATASDLIDDSSFSVADAGATDMVFADPAEVFMDMDPFAAMLAFVEAPAAPASEELDAAFASDMPFPAEFSVEPVPADAELSDLPAPETYGAADPFADMVIFFEPAAVAAEGEGVQWEIAMADDALAMDFASETPAFIEPEAAPVEGDAGLVDVAALDLVGQSIDFDYGWMV